MKKTGIFTILLVLGMLGGFLAAPVQAQISGALSPYDWIRSQSYGSGAAAIQADSVSTLGAGSCSTSAYWFGDKVPYGCFALRYVSRDSVATTKDSTFLPKAYYKYVYKDANGTTFYGLPDTTTSSLTTWRTLLAPDSTKLLGRSNTYFINYDLRTDAPEGIIFKFTGCLARDTGSVIVRVKAAQPQIKNSLVY
jgi:hypothetical protein